MKNENNNIQDLENFANRMQAAVTACIGYCADVSLDQITKNNDEAPVPYGEDRQAVCSRRGHRMRPLPVRGQHALPQHRSPGLPGGRRDPGTI